MGIPPNKYLERQWELTMNPFLGRPTPEKLHALEKKLSELKKYRCSVPGQTGNDWVERGPDNVGGRAKAILFDPNDPNQKRVFAGGVSGGLWVNEDITDPNSTWRLTSAPENLAVTSISVDPNNPQIMYIGTGESYTHGDVNGNGIWKSTDGGYHWENVFGGQDGEAQLVSNATFSIDTPASLQGDYLAVKASFGPDLTSFSGNLVLVNDGSDNPLWACDALTNANEVNGNIAVIQRGDCYFVDKVKNAQNAGAIGVLMINNVDGYPIVMGGDDPDNTINIPSVMISKEDGQAVIDALSAGTAVHSTISNNEGVEISIGFIVPGITHINDIITRNNNGVTEIYASAGDAYFADAYPFTVLGEGYQGLYKSTDGGASWNRINLPLNPENKNYIPFDLELGADNSIWLSTTTSYAQLKYYGAIMKSSDGNSFSIKYSTDHAGRMELAASKTNPDKFYMVYVNTNTSLPEILKTTNAFSTTNVLPKPDGDSTSAEDFTNGQAFYDLAIETDPNNDETVYIGGIDWFKSTDGGNNWTQITSGYGSSGSNIHPDQHNIAFSGSSKILIAHDGGIAYSGDAGSSFYTRINNFNTTQFYHMGVAPSTAFSGEYFIAGAQDNGTQLIENAQAGINSFTEAQGGDGAYSFFDQDGTDKYYIANYVYNQYIVLYNYSTGRTNVINNESESNGEFINPEALDSHQNILYTNYTQRSADGITYSIRKYSDILSDNVTKKSLTNALIDASPTALKVSPYTTDVTKLYVGLENSKLIVINNANRLFVSYTEITGPEFLGSISDIEFGADENTIFVTFFNYGVNNIFYTEDGGNTWHKKDGNLPDLPVNCILQNPLQASEVIIGTDLGVWRTQNFFDESPTWEQSYNGMSSVKVTDLEMRDDYKVYASTYGRGIFTSQFDDAASIKDNEEIGNKVVLYPNPVDKFIKIENQSEEEIQSVSVFDVTGKQVAFQKDIDRQGMNLEYLPAGNYIVKIQFKNRTVTKKIIKN